MATTPTTGAQPTQPAAQAANPAAPLTPQQVAANEKRATIQANLDAAAAAWKERIANAKAAAANRSASQAFGFQTLTSANGVSLTTVGQSAAKLTLLGGNVSNTSSFIVKRIVVQNPSTNVSAGAVTILTSGDGNVANAVTNGTVLGNLTGPNTYQELSIIPPHDSQTISGANTNSLYLAVNAAANGTVDIRVYGDVVKA